MQRKELNLIKLYQIYNRDLKKKFNNKKNIIKIF